jgi:hypothetical protein
VAGAAQLFLATVGQPGLGILVVAPVVVSVVWLWRPTPVEISIVLLLIGLESVLPLQTGGGRFFDWDLHYQMSRVIAIPHATAAAGLGSWPKLLASLIASDLPQRTPLSAALIASAVAHLAQYGTYQIGSVLLNVIWMWPAGLLLERRGRPRGMVLAVACCPMVVVFALYTWPWGFCCFWLLSALCLADEEGPISWAGCGVCMGAALMTHEGCIGYVIGLAAWLALRRWRIRGVLAALGSALATCAAIGVPWLLVLDRYATLAQMIRDLARTPGTGAGWLGGRLELIFTTVIPRGGDGTILDDLFVFLSVSVVGITLALLVTRTLRAPQGPVAWWLAGGLLGGLLLLPTGSATGGLYDTAFPGIVGLFVVSVAACPASRWRGLAVTGLALAAATGLIIWIEAAFPARSDPNLALKVTEHLQFIADVTVIPGLVLMASGLALGIVRAHDWWDAGLRPASAREAGLEWPAPQ